GCPAWRLAGWHARGRRSGLHACHCRAADGDGYTGGIALDCRAAGAGRHQSDSWPGSRAADGMRQRAAAGTMSMRMSYLLTLVLAGALSSAAAQPAAAPEQVARGEYLARIGNCAGCHTAPGGADFAGGRAIDSLFGTFYAPNITADADTGI